MSKMNTVKSFNSLSAIVNPTEGMVMFCEEENKHFMYKEGWQEIKGEATELGFNMSLFDINAQIISQLPTYDIKLTQEAIDAINKFHSQELNKHYMLLCKEKSYFTIFELSGVTVNEFNTLGQAVATISGEIGEIKSIYANPNGDFDIWVIAAEDDIWCLHLFPYDMGVINFG